MLNYKDIETIFSNPAIINHFIDTRNAYNNRHNSETDNAIYKRMRKELQLMVENKKGA